MQVLRWKTMLLPLLMARQSSWLWIVLRRSELDPRMNHNAFDCISVLDGQLGRADIEAVGVVASRLAIACRVGGVSGSYAHQTQMRAGREYANGRGIQSSMVSFDMTSVSGLDTLYTRAGEFKTFTFCVSHS